ncbi:MAG: hypothetical protein Q9161_005153 [Pseudevernia consocians]
MADGAVGCDSSYAQLPVHHDAAYYEKWKRERQEAVARYLLPFFYSSVSYGSRGGTGEDPNAKFLALVAQREANSTAGWWRRLFKKGSQAHGEGLTAGEERKGLESDMKHRVGEGNDDGKGDGIVR